MSASSPVTVVLGAGASRSVSYANRGGHPSPLDFDFFDLLRRLKPDKGDRPAVQKVLKDVGALPADYWRSMERAFYTLHMKAYIEQKLSGVDGDKLDHEVIRNFAVCIQALLRKAHRKDTCRNHAQILKVLGGDDTVISFNYDLVVERALRPTAEHRSVEICPALYALDGKALTANLPPILKLHGSSNWRMSGEGEHEQIELRTCTWEQFDAKPNYRGHLGEGSRFPIFLPFWDKRIEKGPWLPIWREAFQRLKRTKRILVWGYSLPTTDVKAQHLFALALSATVKDLCIVDPSMGTRNRWREVLPNARYWEYDSIKDFLAEPPEWWLSLSRSPGPDSP